MEIEKNSTVREQIEDILGPSILKNDKNYVSEIMSVCGIPAIDPTFVSGQLRNHGNYTLGVLLTAVEAALGDSKQSEALKAIVRREMFMMIDRNQAEHYESLKMQKTDLASPEKHVAGQDELR